MRFFPNGIIPACAGSTKRFSSTEMPFRDHPRMCGEHLDAGSEQKPCPGSSPHVRGALQVTQVEREAVGIIPACAGSTQARRNPAPPLRDHPRMCGEHFTYRDGLTTLQGSSPHVRGARHGAHWRRLQFGIIPACAGSTTVMAINALESRDHPRMCGEHAGISVPLPQPTGSSPHVRGALVRRFPLGREKGIIPACAGSTSPIGTD